MNVQAESAGKTTDDMSCHRDEFGASSENDFNVTQREFLEQRIRCSEESIQHECDFKSEVVPKSGKTSFESLKKPDFSEVASDQLAVYNILEIDFLNNCRNYGDSSLLILITESSIFVYNKRV